MLQLHYAEKLDYKDFSRQEMVSDMKSTEDSTAERICDFHCKIYKKMHDAGTAGEAERSIKEPLEYQKEQKFAEDKMYGGTVL